MEEKSATSSEQRAREMRGTTGDVETGGVNRKYGVRYITNQFCNGALSSRVTLDTLMPLSPLAALCVAFRSHVVLRLFMNAEVDCRSEQLKLSSHSLILRRIFISKRRREKKQQGEDEQEEEKLRRTFLSLLDEVVTNG